MENKKAEEAAKEYAESKFPYLSKEEYYKTDYTNSYNHYKGQVLDTQQIAEDAFIAGQASKGEQPGLMQKHINMMKTALSIVKELGEESAVSAIESCIDNAELLLSESTTKQGEAGIGAASFHEQDDKFYCSHCQQPISPTPSAQGQETEGGEK